MKSAPSVLVSIKQDVNNNTHCQSFEIRNSSFLGINMGGFEVIAETMLINIIVVFVILIIFTYLKVVSRRNNSLSSSKAKDMHWIQLFYGIPNIMIRSRLETESGSDSTSSSQPQGLFHWFFALIHFRDNDFLLRSGIDAVHYLNFQRYIIGLCLIISVLNMCVILPINYQGTFEPSREPFARTTLRNINPKDPVAWVHPIACLGYFILAVIILNQYCKLFVTKYRYLPKNNALVINNISGDHRDAYLMKTVLNTLGCGILIKDFHFSYNVKQLIALDIKRKRTESAIDWCTETIIETDERPQLSLKRFGYVHDVCCPCFCDKKDALSFYTQKRNNIMDQMQSESVKALDNPLGSAFVSFETHQMAESVLQVVHKARYPEDYDFIKKWEVHYSPAPGDILWENQGTKKKNWYLRTFIVNFTLLIVIVFFSTPNVVMSLLGLPEITKKLLGSKLFLIRYVPTLLLLILSNTLPAIVLWLSPLVPYKTRTDYYSSVNKKLYVFLLLMVVILPATGMTSVDALLQSFADEGDLNWKCVFLADSGIFFSLYLLQAGMIGVSMQLIRLSELFMYTIRLCWSYSKAELIAVRKVTIYEYEFGYHYAYFLLQTSIIIIFSTMIPIVAPCGLIYLINKHFVDCYNIYFAYAAAKVSDHVHKIAVDIAVSIFFVQMFLMTGIAFIRHSFDAVFNFYLTLTLFILGFFLIQIYPPSWPFFSFFKLPIGKKDEELSETILGDEDGEEAQEEESLSLGVEQKVYLPKVLIKKPWIRIRNDNENEENQF